MDNLFLAQAQANRAINEAWYGLLSPLPVEQIDRPQGAFFGTIFGTLNHILLGDRIWLGRIHGRPFAFEKLSDRLAGDMATLWPERRATDEKLVALTGPETDFTRLVEYSRAGGETYRTPLHEVLMHLFAHQHHHRGQISQMCHEQGIPIPDGGTIGYTRNPVS